MDMNSKEWWIDELNGLLVGSAFEAIDNPTATEDNVIVVSKGTTKPHYMGIKPLKNGSFRMWARKDYVDVLPSELIPADRELVGQMYHFKAGYNRNFPRNVAKVMSGKYEDPIKEKIQFVIQKYKENFATVDKDERYKWIAVEWYKKHWDLEAEDFAEMVRVSFEKTANLLTAGMYYAYKMLYDYSTLEPEKVRELFKVLYNESLPLSERVVLFRKGFDDYILDLKNKTNKTYNHYQDLHALSVYLFFEYPSKYFIYKSSMYTKLRDRVGFVEEDLGQKPLIRKYDNYARLCEVILQEMDDEVKNMSLSRLDEDCYKDESYHLLAMDIAFYGGVMMEDADFGKEVVKETGEVGNVVSVVVDEFIDI